MADAKLWSTIDRIATLTDTLMVGAPGKDVAADSSNTTEPTQESMIEMKQMYQTMLRCIQLKIAEIQTQMENAKTKQHTNLTPEEITKIVATMQDQITEFQDLAQRVETNIASMDTGSVVSTPVPKT